MLQTLFQFLEYGDEITFKLTDADCIERVDKHGFDLPKEDLCIRAAKLLKEHIQLKKQGVTIELHKKVPPGSGLGAGSSNAATTLLALNQLWNAGLSKEELMDIGRSLGADIPIFLYGHAAWAEGIGDKFTPCSPAISWYCIVIPEVQVSTQEIFCDPDLIRDHSSISYQDYIAGQAVNDLEPVTKTRYPLVAHALRYLSQFGDARMSGTGSSVFVVTKTQKLAREILNDLPPRYTGFVARSTNTNPLQRQLTLP